MRRLPFILSILAIAITCNAVAAADAVEPRMHNIARAFTEFWDASKDKPSAERVAAFKKEVALLAPAFYGVERFNGALTQEARDKHIERAIDGFAAIREEYVRKANQFEAQLPRYVASFKTWFPDYRPTHDTYVLHSLGEMDGGMRTLNDRSALIFGIDAMVQYHGAGDETAFFHHELFHTYHSALNDCAGYPIWTALWREGLATFVAKSMNPNANETELLLAIPNDMVAKTKAALPAALAHLESALENTDQPTYAGLFNNKPDDTGFSPRRGYYLGYLVAKQAAKQRSVQELAKLNCSQARDVVFSAVRTLRESSR
jgi:hypothetical protein